MNFDPTRYLPPPTALLLAGLSPSQREAAQKYAEETLERYRENLALRGPDLADQWIDLLWHLVPEPRGFARALVREVADPLLSRLDNEPRR